MLLNFLWLLKLMSVWVDLMFFVNLFPLRLFFCQVISKGSNSDHDHVLLQCDVDILLMPTNRIGVCAPICFAVFGFKCTCSLAVVNDD